MNHFDCAGSYHTFYVIVDLRLPFTFLCMRHYVGFIEHLNRRSFTTVNSTSDLANVQYNGILIKYFRSYTTK